MATTPRPHGDDHRLSEDHLGASRDHLEPPRDADQANELALAELGEEGGFDDDPVLTQRVTEKEPALVGAGVAGTAGATGALPTTAPAPTARRRPARRRQEVQLPTEALVHTPTAAQASDPELTPEAQRIINARKAGSGRRAMGIIALTVLVAVGAFGIRLMGSTEMENQEMPPAQMAGGMGGAMSGPVVDPEPIDETIVSNLEARVAENPMATGTMNSLADLYFAANDYPNSARWHERVVEINPSSVDNWMMLGISYYSMDDLARAEQSWSRALEINPQTVEAYYNLGFLYMTTERPEEAREAWDHVLDLAPGTHLAQTVESHLATPQTGQ